MGEQRSRLDQLVRLVIIVSIIFSTLPVQPVLAGPPQQGPPERATPEPGRKSFYLPLIFRHGPVRPQSQLYQPGADTQQAIAGPQGGIDHPPAGPPAKIRLSATTEGQPQSDQATRNFWLAVQVVDAAGLAVVDKTEVRLSAQGGTLREAVLFTAGGLATTRLQVPGGQAAVVTAQAGSIEASLQVAIQTPDQPAARFKRHDKQYGQGAAKVAARNKLEAQGNGWVTDNASREVSFDATARS